MIGESSYKAKARMRDVAPLKEYGKPSKNDDDIEYSQVMRELEHAKREFFQLKLDVASVLEEKQRAEKEIEASRFCIFLNGNFCVFLRFCIVGSY
ncbi:hypothetical protein JHK82_047998 [Glycine max]|uniref:Uncharacterized protein n=1 Tax=Glycine soja TaxID=3848 RepID=A0A0B2PDR0_GLYSO|nr:hypothetical protein JHK82_047998 [Glycine max]KHN05743.1 hypothetical protein glysoja_043694 [Glycine soja]